MIESITNSQSRYESTANDPAQEIQDSFLQMLIAQLEFQDPLNPIENTEFTAQLAQINTVQQLQSLNQNFNYMQLYMASINNSQSISFIGKDVVATGNSLFLNNGNTPEINYRLQNNAASVAVSIYDQNNRLVDTIHAGSQNGGSQSITWRGYDSNGNRAADGTYTYKVHAVDLEGNPVETMQMTTGTVDGVTFTDGISYVTVSGQKVPIGDIIEIREKPSISSSQSYVDLIGHTVTAGGNTVYYDGESDVYLNYTLENNADEIVVRIFDSDDNLVRIVTNGSTSSGDRYSVWDGLNENGDPAAPGEYTYRVSAVDDEGVVVGTRTIITGEVESITYDKNGNAYAVIGELLVPVDTILEVEDEPGAFENVSSFARAVGSVALKVAPFLL